MGASSALILSLLLKETLPLAASGAVAGILLTYASQWFMKHFVPSSLVQETVYAWWPIAACIAIVGALMGTSIPVMKAVHQDVTTALAYE